MTKKYIGGQVSTDLHRLAHLSAKLEGMSLNAWLERLLEQNINPAARLFFAETVQFGMQNNKPNEHLTPNVIQQRTLALAPQSEAEPAPNAHPPTPNAIQQRTLAAADTIARALAPQADEVSGGDEA